MTQVLLTLITSPSLESTITDWLLEQENIAAFTTVQAHGHGNDPESLSLIEQVEGRKKQIMFNIHLDLDLANSTVKDLKRDFKGAKVHYWLAPILDSGKLA